MNFHPEVLTPSQKRVLKLLGPFIFQNEFYLPGGTGSGSSSRPPPIAGFRLVHGPKDPGLLGPRRRHSRRRHFLYDPASGRRGILNGVITEFAFPF